MNGFLLNDKDATDWLFKRMGGLPPVSWSIAFQDAAGAIEGGWVFDRYTGPGGSVHAHFAGRPGWLTRRRIRTMADYLFVNLDCCVVWGEVPDWNTRAQDIDERLGFKRHCVLEGYFKGGADCILYRMHRDDCRWLSSGEGDHGKQIRGA